MEFQMRSPIVTQINDHIWLMNDHDEATWYVVAGKEKAMVIDTSIGLSNIHEEARKVTDLPLILVNTHGHGDHIGGNWSFPEAYMSHKDLDVAKASLEWPEVQVAIKQFNLTFPDFLSIEDGQVFELGGVTLQAYDLPGHTPGEIVLLDREDRILFSGDAVIEQLWMQLPESLPIPELVKNMERLLTIRDDYDIILSGHSRSPEDASLYDDLLDAAKDLAAGHTDGDVEYTWQGGTCKAHPYGDEPRRIVYNTL